MNALQLPVGPSGTWRRGLATAAGLFLLLGFASAATAQSSSPGANPAPIVGIEPNDCDERLEGLLNAIDATNRTFTIGTTLVRTDFRTEFEDGAGATLQFESFQLGDLLKARGCYLPDGSLQAENVELEVHGGGTPTPNATITPTPTPNPTGTPAGTQTPAPTQTPNTTQTPNPTGTPNATQTPVPTVTPGGPINCEQDVEGFLSSLDSGARTMTIAGVLVRTDNRTEFEDEFSNTISFDAFAVGFGAEAEGCFLADGSLQAQKVEIQFRSSVTPTGTPNPTVTPTGTPDGTQTPAPTQTPNLGANNCGQDVEASVQAINATARTFTIGGVLVRTDSRTRYEDALSNNVSFEFFQVGFAAEAKGCFLSDGSLLAAKVEAQNNVSVTPTVTPTPDPSATVTPTVTPTGTPGLPNNNCDHEIESFVTVVDSANGTMIIGGVLVRTDGRTYYEDRNDTPLTFGDFGPGDKAEAEGCFQSDGSLLAKKIELKLGNLETPIPTPTPNPSGTPTPAPGGEDISLFGTIGTIDLLGSTLTIDNVTFLVDANTRIQDRTDLPLTFEDLRIDMRVLVEGDSLGNGTFRAREIKVLEENVVPGGGTSQRLTGITSSIVAGESMIVGQTEVDLTGNPTVRNFDGLPVSIAQIGEGDFVKVEGLPQTSGTLLASAIEVRASLLSAVNNEQTRLFASNTEVQVTAATEIMDPTSGTIAFEDLTVGDLIEIQGSFNGAMLNAREIRRVSPLRFSGVIAGFAPVIPTIKGGAGAVRSANNVNTFGFVELPERTFPNVPNAIFELTARIRTDVATRSEVPVARVRTNMNTFTKGAEFVVTSEGDGRFAPTLEGKEYRSYFVPALGATDGNLADWYASMDLLNVNPNDAPQAELILESISAKPIDFSRLTVAETLYQESFSTAGHGWTNGGAPGTYSLPAFGQDGVKKALTVTPGDANTFGFWEFNTGIPVQPNTLYRGRFLVSADASNPTAVPTVRGRLNLTSFQLASVTVLESVGDAAESPAATPRLYDVYLYIPGVPVSGESILAAFDVLNNQGDNDTGRPVYLEHFTLERLTIAP